MCHPRTCAGEEEGCDERFGVKGGEYEGSCDGNDIYHREGERIKMTPWCYREKLV